MGPLVGARGPNQNQSPPNAITLVSGDEAAAMTDEAVAAVKNGEVALQTPESSLDASEAKVNTIETSEGTFTMVSVPVVGAYSLTSNFSLFFDSAGDLVQYGETLVSENEAGNFNVTTYAGGALTSDQDTDLPYMSDSELVEDMVNTQSEASVGIQSDKNTGACLATVLGVTGVVGGIIAYACAGACAAAAVGVGVPFCVGCIAGFAVVGGASITGVANCF